MKSLEFEEVIFNYRRIQVCSYDAGGGNVLAHLIHGLGLKPTFIIDGPSLGVYTGLFPDLLSLNSKTLKSETDLLISSTGWQSVHEFKIMKTALLSGIPVIAVLDHWVNYVERFERFGETIMPTYFLAFDDASEDKIVNEFQDANVLRAQNVYLARILQEIKNLERLNTSNFYDFVFIGEPLLQVNKSQSWTEFDAIQLFFETLRFLGLSNSRIAIKPHPSENSLKYSQCIPDDFNNVSLESNTELAGLLAKSRTVVGCHSMALYIGELSGKKVYTALPDGVLPRVPLKRAQPIIDLAHM